jgi:hypothetical protein
MKATVHLRLFVVSVLVALNCALSGCKSTTKVDWDNRVGSFTYDQAEKELGRPLLTTKLNEGGTIADWPTGAHRVGVSGGYGSSAGMGMGQVGQSEFLRLTFDKNGVLKSWKQEFR